MLAGFIASLETNHTPQQPPCPWAPYTDRMPLQSIAIADRHGNFLTSYDAELPVYSIAKPVIASTVFACDIGIDTPIAHWIDQRLVPDADTISVRQLLNHTGGLRDYGALPEYSQAIESGEPPWSDDVFAEHTLQKPLLFEPGAGWSYSNPGYWLLSQIVQIHTGLSFEEVIARYVADPLGLTSMRVVRGQFAEDLPCYPAGWVWHGLLTSTASDVVRFMMSPLSQPLLGEVVCVPGGHPKWNDPQYGYGLMVEPGERYGHNGGGPHYSASCFHFINEGLTGCVLLRSDEDDAAMDMLVAAIDAS